MLKPTTPISAKLYSYELRPFGLGIYFLTSRFIVPKSEKSVYATPVRDWLSKRTSEVLGSVSFTELIPMSVEVAGSNR